MIKTVNAIKLKLEIINSLIIIPGIKGFVEYSSRNKTKQILTSKNWDKAITFKLVDNKYIVNIGIIISFDISAKRLCEKIGKLIANILKQQNKSLKLLNIYIEGAA